MRANEVSLMSKPETSDQTGASRAARLRSEIEKLRDKANDSKPSADKPARSPREFIHDRMRELNKDQRS